MGYGTMYKDMKGPSSGASKAMGFAGNVQAGRQAKAARQAKKEAAGQAEAPKQRAPRTAAQAPKKGNPLARMSPHLQPAQTKFTSQATRGALSGAVSRRGQAQLTPVVKTPEVM